MARFGSRPARRQICCHCLVDGMQDAALFEAARKGNNRLGSVADAMRVAIDSNGYIDDGSGPVPHLLK